MNIQLLRQFIQEQIARGVQTLDTSPNTFEDFQDYDIDIVANVHGKYSLTVKYKGKKISPMTVYNDYDEAHHQSRMIIDRHRVKASNTF